MDMEEFTSGAMPQRFKHLLRLLGLLLALPGLPLSLSLLCSLLVLVFEPDNGSLLLFYLTSILLTLGAGGALAWHAQASLLGKASRPLRLPRPVTLLLAFGLALVAGLALGLIPGLRAWLRAPLLILAAALPGLWAVAWFHPAGSAGITWRRGLPAFAGGATLGVAAAILLEIALPLVPLALVFGLEEQVGPLLDNLVNALSSRAIAEALTSPAFIYIFIQVGLIAPLAEELVKPLAVLPLLRRLERRDAFLLGALSGAGFAALENLIFASLAGPAWTAVLLARALSGAVHPLGAGLVALGWQDVLHGRAGAGIRWLKRYLAAVGLHVAWNGGSLLVITLAGTGFFGIAPPPIGALGYSAAGVTLTLLFFLGLGALWAGRLLGASLAQIPGEIAPGEEFLLSDRAAAIWALACLVAILPAGIIGLRLLLR
jgi:RsiW-degrading membrane proteinase PrsW (M82 family)